MPTTLLDRPAPIVDDATRRQFLAGLAATGLLAGCGSAEPPTPAAPSSGEFPIRIEHTYGTTEISAAPTRVVSAATGEHDFLLALGVIPVGVREWYGNQPFATWPWAQDALGDAQPAIVGDDEINFEAIAALRPDLIVGVSYLSQDEYSLLEQIAPTIAQPQGYPDYGVPWQEQTRITGRAVGLAERAEELVSAVEARFAEARRAHPEFAGAPAVAGQLGDGATQYYVGGPSDPRAQFLTQLGFVLPDEVATLVGDQSNVEISAELLSVIDSAQVVVWAAGDDRAMADEVRNNPVYRQLRVAREGRDVFMFSPVGDAISWNTPLSLPLAIDRLVPQLAAALDGDPATEVPS